MKNIRPNTTETHTVASGHLRMFFSPMAAVCLE